jgi:hypothetical protein
VQQLEGRDATKCYAGLGYSSTAGKSNSAVAPAVVRRSLVRRRGGRGRLRGSCSRVGSSTPSAHMSSTARLLCMSIVDTPNERRQKQCWIQQSTNKSRQRSRSFQKNNLRTKKSGQKTCSGQRSWRQRMCCRVMAIKKKKNKNNENKFVKATAFFMIITVVVSAEEPSLTGWC